MEVKATSKFVRGSNLKYRRYMDLVRGKKAQEALDILDHLPSPLARVIFKTLESAVANADHNHSVEVGDLVVKQIFADQGPIMKRWRPRARGRATPIQKKLSHITVIVGTKGDVD